MAAEFDAHGGMALHHLDHFVEFDDGDVEQGVFTGLEEDIVEGDGFAHFQLRGDLGDLFFVDDGFGANGFGQGEGVEVETSLTCGKGVAGVGVEEAGTGKDGSAAVGADNEGTFVAGGVDGEAEVFGFAPGGVVDFAANEEVHAAHADMAVA